MFVLLGVACKQAPGKDRRKLLVSAKQKNLESEASGGRSLFAG